MKFAIRDDDTSYFTSPQDLESIYSFISQGCISLSVVPYCVPVHKEIIFPYGQDIPFGYYYIGDNKELCEYLKKMIESGRYDILLHGYSHEYKKIGEKWFSEMIWKDSQRLKKELNRGKQDLERILGCKVKVFTAPNNHIDAKGISVIEELKLDYSGVIRLGKHDRKIDKFYVKNFFHRLLFRVIKKQAYGGVYRFKKHKELIAFDLIDYNQLKAIYHQCKKSRTPFVIYTHYWNLKNNPLQLELLKKIYYYAIKDGAELVSVSELFDE